MRPGGARREKGRPPRPDSAEPHAHSTRPTSLFRDKNLFIFVCKRIRSPITFVNKIIGSGLLLKVVYMHNYSLSRQYFTRFVNCCRRAGLHAPARPPPPILSPSSSRIKLARARNAPQRPCDPHRCPHGRDTFYGQMCCRRRSTSVAASASFVAAPDGLSSNSGTTGNDQPE